MSMVILTTCHGYYVPGVRPHEFFPGEEVPMKVNSLTSIHTQVRLLVSCIQETSLICLRRMMIRFIRCACSSIYFLFSLTSCASIIIIFEPTK